MSAYLGSNQAAWAEYDPLQLVQTTAKRLPIVIDQGTDDSFLATQLKPEVFQVAAKEAGQDITLNFRAGYDHSYYFIETFIESHLLHFMKYISA